MLKALLEQISEAKGLGKRTKTLIKAQPLFKSQASKKSLDTEKVSKEAKISLDLGIAISDLVISQNDGIAYAYQELRFLGKPLTERLKKDTSVENNLDIAIHLLIKVDNLHSGKASKSGTKYVHRDIKPDNILIDEYGNLHLIDYGDASSNIKTKWSENGVELAGTLPYLPIDTDTIANLSKESVAVANQQVREKLKNRKTDLLFEDRIATLRTIYNPVVSHQNESILKKEYFDSLPLCIKNLFDTSKIAPFTSDEREKETEKFLAAVLICYKLNPGLQEDEFAKEISDLRINVEKQDEMIHHFIQMKIISQLDDKTANNLVGKLGTILTKHQDYLIKEYNLLDIESANKYDVPQAKKLAIDKMLAIINNLGETLTPQKKLIHVFEEFKKNTETLTKDQKPKEEGYWKQIKYFFANIFNINREDKFVKNIKNEMAGAIYTQFYKNTINAMHNEPKSTNPDEPLSNLAP